MENNFLFYFQEGINNHKKGNINDALISFDKCLSINPIDEEALINRGLMKYILKSYTSALNDYTKAIEINCQNNNAYYNRALCYKELSKYDDALSDLNIIKV